MAEMRKTTREFCQKCKYSISNGATTGSKYSVTCGYFEKTEKRRGCPVGWCDKFEPKVKRRKRE